MTRAEIEALEPGDELDGAVAAAMDLPKEVKFPNQYSTCIASAWDAVEKFQLSIRPLGDLWVAIGGNESAFKKTACHAICICALLVAEARREKAAAKEAMEQRH